MYLTKAELKCEKSLTLKKMNVESRESLLPTRLCLAYTIPAPRWETEKQRHARQVSVERRDLPPVNPFIGIAVSLNIQRKLRQIL